MGKNYSVNNVPTKSDRQTKQVSTFVVVAVVIVLGLSGFLGASRVISNNRQKAIAKTLPSYPRVRAKIGKEHFSLLKTHTAKEMNLGLSIVPKLPDHYGMIIPGKHQIGIWMKDMHYPIDIIWLDKDNAIIHIVNDAQPSSYPKTTFRNPAGTEAVNVIELPAGEAQRLELQVGSKVQFD